MLNGMSSRIRLLCGAAALAVAQACNSSDPASPSAPYLGAYTLTSVQGRAVPFIDSAAGPNVGRTTTYISGSLRLNSDGTFTTTSLVHWSGFYTAAQDTTVARGTYHVGPDTLLVLHYKSVTVSGFQPDTTRSDVTGGLMHDGPRPTDYTAAVAGWTYMHDSGEE